MRTIAAQEREKSDPFIPTSLPMQAAGPAPLADIAFRVPEARAAAAAKPSTYPDLLQWLAQLDEPAIPEALEGRRSPS